MKLENAMEWGEQTSVECEAKRKIFKYKCTVQFCLSAVFMLIFDYKSAKALLHRPNDIQKKKIFVHHITNENHLTIFYVVVRPSGSFVHEAQWKSRV